MVDQRNYASFRSLLLMHMKRSWWQEGYQISPLQVPNGEIHFEQFQHLLTGGRLEMENGDIQMAKLYTRW